MTSLFEYCARNPRKILLAAIAIVMVASPGVVWLELMTDGHALVPRHDPAILYDREVREVFGVRDLIAVTITAEEADDIYNTSTLALARDFSESFTDIEGVEPGDIMSLATEKRDRVRPGTLTFRTFLEPFPDSETKLEELRTDVHAVGIVRGTLVSLDDGTTAVLVGVDQDDERMRIHEDILDTIARTDTAGHTVRVVGAPVAESQLGLHLIEDLTLLVPLVMAIIAAVIYRLAGTVWAVVLGVCEVGATLAFTFGVMGWAGVPVYLTTAILPVTLTAIAIADELHIFGSYMHRLAGATIAIPKVSILIDAMDDVGRAIVVTSVTTAIAFLSFTASPIEPIQAFGLFQCLGVLFAMVWSLTVTPAALALIDRRRFRRRLDDAAETRGLDMWLQDAARWVVRRRRMVLTVTAAVLLLTPLGVSQIFVQDSWIGGFSTDSAFYRNTAFVDRNFHGTHVLNVTLEADGDPGSLLVPEKIALIGALENRIAEHWAVGGVLGPHSHLRTINYLMHARREEARKIPDNATSVGHLVDYMEKVRGERRRREVFDDEGRRALITVFLERANFIDTARVMKAVRDFETDELAPSGLRVEFAGDIGVSQAMIPAIVDSQVRSLVLTLAGILLVAALLTGSLAQGICCALPAACAALLVFATMGAFGIPLGVATSMFCAITLGIGVDYGVHLTIRAKRLTRDGRGPETAVADAVALAGRMITIDAVAVGAGFALLLISQVPANARLGGLVALSVALCYVLSMFVLPALLCTWKPAFLAKARGRN